MSNVSELSLDELLALQTEVLQSIEKQKDKAILEIIERMKAMNIGIDELSKVQKFHSPSTKKPKYRNPENHNEVWVGLGKSPTWFKTCLEKGVTKEDMLIP